MERKDKLALWISFVALVLSAGNIAYTVVKDSRDQSENLSCDVRTMLSDYETTVTPFAGTGEISVGWEGTLANNGTVPVALVGHELYSVASNTKNLGSFSGMDAGLFDSSGNQLQFPINLSPGQAIRFQLRTGIILPRQVYNALSPLTEIGTKISSKKLMLSLGAKGIDFFGNSVKLKEFPSPGFVYEGPEFSTTLHNPEFRLTFRTARGRVVATQFSYYGIYLSP